MWDLILTEGYQLTVHRVAIALLSIPFSPSLPSVLSPTLMKVETYHDELIVMPFENLMRFLVQTEWLLIDPDAFITTVRKIKINKKVIRAIDYNETL